MKCRSASDAFAWEEICCNSFEYTKARQLGHTSVPGETAVPHLRQFWTISGIAEEELTGSERAFDDELRACGHLPGDLHPDEQDDESDKAMERAGKFEER